MLEVRLLGRFAIRQDDRVVEVPLRAAQSLLAYLILSAGTPHPREKLAGLIWPDFPESSAKSNLRHALWRLRKALGTSPQTGRDYLLADDLTVAFDADADYCLDAAALERQGGEAATSDELIGAVSVCGGELLPGFYDEWVILERERLEAVFERKMQRLLECLVAEQRWEEALEWGERWIALGHAPEPAYRALMVAHSGLGDLSRTAAVYQRCVEALHNELGVVPSEQTRALYELLAQGGKLMGVPAEATVRDRRLRPTPVLSDEGPAPGDPPFKGLQYFDEADADLFFGREMLTARLVGHLRDHHFLAVVVGASGSGKSSIVRAGLVPALRRGEPLADGLLPPEGSAQWPVHVITPTTHPLEALAASLTREAEAVTATATLIDDLARDPRSLHLYVRRLLDHVGAGLVPAQGRPYGDYLLLVIDQFEELFTLCRNESERKAFVDNLLTAAGFPSPVGVLAERTGDPASGGLRAGRGGGGGPTIVVITLRADFYAHCAQYANLREALAKHQEYIGPMSTEELRRAIEEPARRGGWEFEPGLVDLLLRDAGDEPGALPLLSHALLETWKRRRGRTLTLQGYAESSGVRGAIAKTAETVFNQQLTPEQQAIARNIFIRLTELGEGTQDTRRRAALSELIPNPQLQPLVESVLKTLADARLITTGEGTVEVAHEALIHEWPTLRQWLAEDREGLRLHRHLTEAAQEWEALERDQGALYRGARLSQAREWAEAHVGELNALEREFLAASQDLARQREAEREAQRQRELEAAQRLAEAQRQRAEAERRRAEEQTRTARQLRRRAVFLTGALIVAGLLAAVALVFGQQATRQARLSRSRELAAAAISNLEVDPERSILLALEAVSATYTLEAEDALHRGVQASRVQLTLRGHTAEVWFVAFSPDGTRLATASQDKTAKVWDAITDQELLTLSGHSDVVNGVVFSPDGQRLATTSEDNTAKVWDATTGQELLTLTGHTAGVLGIAYSPDGTRLATASKDRTVKVWDASTGQELLTLTGYLYWALDVTFSPDGKRLATTGADATARVWDVATGDELLTLAIPGEQGYITFSPDGSRLAVAAGGSAKVLEAATGKELLTLSGHTNSLFGIAYSPDGMRLAAGSSDRKAIVWDALTGQELLTLSGHAGAVNGIAFSPDGMRLATASSDGTAKVWNLSLSREMLSLSTPDGSGPVAFNPDGTRLAAGLADGTAKVWDATTGKDLLSLTGHTAEILSLAYSPLDGGTRLVTSSADKTTKVWDLAAGKELFTLSGHTAAVGGIAFSPDGTRLATASDDRNVKVWDATTGRPLLTLSFSNSALAVAFSPDGARLAAACSDGTAKVWDATTGEELLSLTGHADAVWGITFSPDGKRLATAGGDGTAKIWDAATGQELLTLVGHTSTVVGVAFSPDGKRLATASRDGTAKLWDATTGQELLTLSGDDGGGLNGVAFSPDGTRLATSGDIAVRVYALRIKDLVALARSRVTRRLTGDECLNFRLAQASCALATQAPAASTPIRPPAAKGKVCQVADASGGVDERSFNQMIYEGAQDSAEKFGWASAVIETREATDYGKHIAEFLRSNCDLIVTTFFVMSDATIAAAKANPNQKFLILDVDSALDNVWGQVYATDQAAFLAGYLAASATKTGKVGAFGGVGIPPVLDFMDGFALGVAYYNEKHGTNVQVLGWDVEKREGLFVGDFCCAKEGRRMAETLMDQGADIILPVTGPTVGLGTAAAIQERGNAYVIGVDTDWAMTYPEYADVVLTSIEKRLNVSVVVAVKAIVEGTFTGGTHLGTLESGEVGLSPFHNLEALVPAQVKAELDQVKADITPGRSRPNRKGEFAYLVSRANQISRYPFHTRRPNAESASSTANSAVRLR